MALHEYQLQLAIKWALTLIRNGSSIKEACKTAGKWCKADPKTVEKVILYGMEAINADTD